MDLIPPNLLSDIGIVRLLRPDNINNYIFRYLVGSTDEYTGIGEALGASMISGFLEDKKLSKNIEIARSSDFQYRVIDQNLIILGGWIASYVSLAQLKARALIRYNDSLWLCENGIIHSTDRQNTSTYNNSPRFDYALISKLPGTAGNTFLFIEGIGSPGTQGGAKYITDIDAVSETMKKLTELSGSIPSYFQIIVRVGKDPTSEMFSNTYNAEAVQAIRCYR